MKKHLLLLIFPLMWMGCESQSEMDCFIENSLKNGEEAVTRSTNSDISNFDILSEIDRLPVHIINIGNTENPYLSCYEKENRFDLRPEDDNSGRQKWFFRNSFLVSSGGTRGEVADEYRLVLPNDFVNPEYLAFGNYKKTFVDNMNPSPGVSIINNLYYFTTSDGYLLLAARNDGSSVWPSKFRYLQSESTRTLMFRDDASTNLARWEIRPIGSFELVDLQYVKTETDIFNASEIHMGDGDYQNDTPIQQNHEFLIDVNYSVSSDFSKTEGVSVSTSGSLSVGLPDILEGVSIGVALDQQSSRTVTYGRKKEYSVRKTYTSHVAVPANTRVKVHTVLVMNEGTLTYVATLRRPDNGNTFRVRGKWNGAMYSKIIVRTYVDSTNVLLDEKTINISD